MKKDYYTVKETADLFGVKQTNVYFWIYHGILTPQKGAGGKYQITDADIDAAIKNLQMRGIYYDKRPNS